MAGALFFDVPYTGQYSLAASIDLAAGAAFATPMQADGRMDLAFVLDRSWETVGLRLMQGNGKIHANVIFNPDQAPLPDMQAQIARMLSLDQNGDAFAALAANDTVIAALQRQRPGIRPVMFPTPYECAARAIIGQRLFLRHAAAMQARVAATYGVPVDFGDHTVHAFPAPGRLAPLQKVVGMADRKVAQLRALAAAAMDGVLDTGRLRMLPRDQALTQLQHLPGIGPFSADLILIRGAGDPDAFPRTELRLQRAMMRAYGIGPDFAAMDRIADGWRPFRSWVGLLLRNAS
jgi:DNA-3-methyladenine glycosylase II